MVSRSSSKNKTTDTPLKRPLNAYMLFSNSIREAVIKETGLNGKAVMVVGP